MTDKALSPLRRKDIETGRKLEREAIVAWLREQDDPSEKWSLQNSHWYAAEIEAGEHLG